MKKIFSFGLMAALVFGISMSVASCKDDNDSKSEEQRAEEQKAQATKALKFYDVVSHLADLSEMNDETYESQTFEPVVGEEDAGDPQTRIVATNDLETAAMRFADIVGLTAGSGFPASTPSYTWSDPDVGTLTYTKSTDGQSWAEVDVDIKQVPHLTKIVYCSPDQMGDNGKFDGTAYYRFGDVISREYTSKSGKKCTEYWICVRPAFGKEGKGDTHWISVGELPEDNMFHHSGSNGTEYYVPTKVCTDEENMQNFAEMLYAIFHPVDWRQHLSDNSGDGLKMFWDFDFKNIKYHNQYFWKEVYDGWKEKGIAEKAFNMTSMDELKKILDTEGLNLLYSGYSWLTTFSWYCELYNICYTSGTGAEANFHKVKKETVKKNMKDLKFDCHEMGQNVTNYNGFFGDNKHRWVVRYAKGKQLMARGTFNKFEGIVGCEDVWNYNKQYGPTEKLSNSEPRQSIDHSRATNATNDGAGTYQYGDVVKDEQGNRWFCILGSPFQPELPLAEDHTAWFVSFDFNGIDTSGSSVSGLPTEAELPEVAYRLSTFIGYLAAFKEPHYFHPGAKLAQDGDISRDILNYAGVDLGKLWVSVDSMWVFTSIGKQFNSSSKSLITNLAYNDGNTGKQAICRVVYDFTQAGKYRTACSSVNNKKFEDWHWRLYNHYEHYDASQIRQPDGDEASLGMTKWHLPWAMTTDKIYLQDVADQDVINRHAKDDKWVTLPLTKIGVEFSTTPRRSPRTTALASARPADFIGNYGPTSTPKAHVFNEPVLFLRVMKVNDEGGPDPNLTSKDGRHLTVVHLRNDPLMYSKAQHASWFTSYVAYQKLITVDNQQVDIPYIPGTEVLNP